MRFVKPASKVPISSLESTLLDPTKSQFTNSCFLPSCLIIVYFQGQSTFGGKSLHDLTTKNPYMEVIEYLGQTLEDFDGLTLYIIFYFLSCFCR